MQRITPKRAGTAAIVLTAAVAGSAFAVPSHALAADATTTTITVKSSSIFYGESATATVSVDSTAKGQKPSGKVELKLDGQTLTADLANSGKADFTLPLLNASSTAYSFTATFVPADATAFMSSTSAPAALTVNKDTTTTAVTVRHRKAVRKIIAKTTVTSDHGQVPKGKVKVVLRRNGIKVSSQKVQLSSTGTSRVKFTKVRRTGTYKVISKYLGSSNFVGSKATGTP